VSVELAVAVIAGVVALVSAAITIFGQSRIEKSKAEVTMAIETYKRDAATALEEQRFLLQQYADIGTYCAEQNAALREAYLAFFERKPGLDADPQSVGNLASSVDKDVMMPFRKYETLVDDQTRSKIYQIHNLIAQLRGNPSSEAIANFRSVKGEFFRLTEEARVLLRPSGLLARSGVVGEQRGGPD
jgi:hypothetical protein